MSVKKEHNDEHDDKKTKLNSQLLVGKDPQYIFMTWRRRRQNVRISILKKDGACEKQVFDELPANNARKDSRQDKKDFCTIFPTVSSVCWRHGSYSITDTSLIILVYTVTGSERRETMSLPEYLPRNAQEWEKFSEGKIVVSCSHCRPHRAQFLRADQRCVMCRSHLNVSPDSVVLLPQEQPEAAQKRSENIELQFRLQKLGLYHL